MSNGLSTPSAAIRAPPTPTKRTPSPSRRLQRPRQARAAVVAGRLGRHQHDGQRGRPLTARRLDADDEQAELVGERDHRLAVQHQQPPGLADDARQARPRAARLHRGEADGRQVDAASPGSAWAPWPARPRGRLGRAAQGLGQLGDARQHGVGALLAPPPPAPGRRQTTARLADVEPADRAGDVQRLVDVGDVLGRGA